MLRRTFVLSLPLVTAACTPTHEPTRSGSLPTPAQPEPQPVTPQVATLDFWKWDRGTGEWGEALGRTSITTNEGRYELRTLPVDAAAAAAHSGDDRFGVVSLDSEGTLQWETELGYHFVATGSIVSAGERIYATHHCAIASGAAVSAIHRTTGTILWTRELEGLGPIGHDKYRNETQIEVDERGLVIYGNEAQGEYTEVLDPHTGEARSLGRPDPRFARLLWEGTPEGAPFHFPTGPSELAIDDTHYVLTDPEPLDHPALLERFDGHESAWTTSLRSEGSCGRAAMRVIDGKLWVAHYCAIASGTRLFAVNPKSGERVHDVVVRGLGPVDHSEYFNEVELDELHGHVVVRGRESAGRYIEVVDPATGLTRVNLTFRD